MKKELSFGQTVKDIKELQRFLKPREAILLVKVNGHWATYSSVVRGGNLEEDLKKLKIGAGILYPKSFQKIVRGSKIAS